MAVLFCLMAVLAVASAAPNTLVEAPSGQYLPPQEAASAVEPQYALPDAPTGLYTAPEEAASVAEPQYVAPPPSYVPSQQQVQHVPEPVYVAADASVLDVRYTNPDEYDVNENPGVGSSGPLGRFVEQCAASLVCVPLAMCNPYTGYVRGGLLYEPNNPALPTVALDRCYNLKEGGIGDGVCCQMPHINDPWPEFQ